MEFNNIRARAKRIGYTCRMNETWLSMYQQGSEAWTFEGRILTSEERKFTLQAALDLVEAEERRQELEKLKVKDGV